MLRFCHATRLWSQAFCAARCTWAGRWWQFFEGVCDGRSTTGVRFRLEGARLRPDGHRRQTLHTCRSSRTKGLLVMFICNHCPYVKAVRDRMIRDCAELKALGIGSVAISSKRSRRLSRGLFRKHAARCARSQVPVSLSFRRDPGSRARLWSGVARRIFSVSTRTWDFSTGAGSTPRATRRPRTHAANYSRP